MVVTQSRPTDIINSREARGTPMQERTKQDFNYMLIKFAETFVNNDELRKQGLLEELTKFRNTNKYEIENLIVREELARKQEEVKHIQKNLEFLQGRFDKEVTSLRRDLENEKKDLLIVMNQMIKSMETEKHTRIKAYQYLSNENPNRDQEVSDTRMKDRLAQNQDDVEFYKGKLLEKISYMEKESNMRINLRNFNKKLVWAPEGLKFYGHPRSLDHIYDLIGKLKQNVYTYRSPKRKAVLEDIALYLQYKPTSFLRHFGFAKAVGTNLEGLDIESQEICLFILNKMAQDNVLALEIYEDGVYKAILKGVLLNNPRLRLASLTAFDPVCHFPQVQGAIIKKVSTSLPQEIDYMMMYMEEYLESNFSPGISILWSIFCKLTLHPELSQMLINKGIIRFISQSVDFSHSHKLSSTILLTLKRLYDVNKNFKVKCGPKFVYNLLTKIDTASQDNLLLIVSLLCHTGIETSERSSAELSRKTIQKVLEVGISSSNEVKFSILVVIEKMFSKRNSLLGSKLNTERILLLIMSALNHGTTAIKETASKLTLTMILTENIDLSQEPDLISLVLLNCKLFEAEYFELRKLSIEIIFRMAISVRYVNLIVLNSQQILDTIKISISILHPEINHGGSQNLFLLFDKVRIEDEKGKDMEKDEDTMIYLNKVQGYKERVIQQIEVDNELSPETYKRRQPTRKMTMKPDENDMDDDLGPGLEDTEPLLQDIESNMTDVEFNIINHTKNVIAYYDKVNTEHAIKKVDSKGAEIYTSTYYLIKTATVLLSCDITYLKVFHISLPSICGIVLEKAIGARETVVVDSILTFYNTLFDIIYFRTGGNMNDSLISLINILANRFTIKILKILKKELDTEVSDMVILCTLINSLMRLLMKEESASVLTKFTNLGPVLEKIIEKGLKNKSPNILLMASILGTHLSIYPEFQQYLFNREFIAYQMGLLEPSSSEYIQAWGANSENSGETVMAGENLVFMQKIMQNSDIIIQMTSLMLNNLCHQQDLAKILGSLPIKYGVKPLAKIFLIDKTKVSKLIQCLCLDSDFQSKMASFVPVDFKSALKEIEEAELYAKGSKGASSFLYKRYESPTEKKEKKDKKKGEEEQKNPFEEMKELIHDPKSMSVQKGRDYHEKITRIIFLNSDPDDLVWRRVIKVSMLHLKDESTSSILWMGKLLKPLRVVIDPNYVTFDDIQQINFDWEKKEDFYYKIDDLEDEVMPEDSMSGIMKKLKVYPNFKYNAKNTHSQSQSMLNLSDNNSFIQRSYDYEIDDPGLSVVNLQLQNPADPDDSILAHPIKEDPRRGIKDRVDDELNATGKPQNSRLSNGSNNTRGGGRGDTGNRPKNLPMLT